MLGSVAKFGRVRERRTRSGAVHWYIDARPYGRIYQWRDSLGAEPFTSPEQAERALERIRARIEEVGSAETVIGKLLPKGCATLGERIDAYQHEQERRAAAREMTDASLYSLTRQIAHYWGPFRELPVGGVTAGHLSDWQTWLLEGGLAPVTARGVVSYFASFLRWLYDREEIDRVPRMPKLRVPEHEPKLLRPDAQEAALAQIPEPQRGLFLAGVDLALRPNEARAVRFSDFELVDGVPWVTIRRAFTGQQATSRIRDWTKTGRIRRLPVTDRLWAWVQAHGARTLGPAFVLRGRPWSGWQANRVWKAACEAAGVPVVPLRNATRHSTATRLRSAGRIEDVKELLGHTDLRTTERYARHEAGRLVPLVRLVPRVSTTDESAS